MSIAAGRLRHRIQIQDLKPVLDSNGNPTQDPVTGEVFSDWMTIATVWAAVEPLSARELIAAQAVQSKVTARMVIRYRDGLNAAMRIIYRNRIYNIHGLLEDTSSGLEYITIPVSEGVSVTGQ